MVLVQTIDAIYITLSSFIKCLFGMINFANLFYYSVYFYYYSWVSLHFFDTIHRSHYTISANFYIYLQCFQQKVFNFSKINRFQMLWLVCSPSITQQMLVLLIFDPKTLSLRPHWYDNIHYKTSTKPSQLTISKIRHVSQQILYFTDRKGTRIGSNSFEFKTTKEIYNFVYHS